MTGYKCGKCGVYSITDSPCGCPGIASFYVLVTTGISLIVGPGAINQPAVAAGIHTSVLEFSTKEQADAAVVRVNKRIGMEPLPQQLFQNALPLY